MPRTKQMASRMLDLPLPLRPVMALKNGSKSDTTVRCAYDLKPSMMISYRNRNTTTPCNCEEQLLRRRSREAEVREQRGHLQADRRTLVLEEKERVRESIQVTRPICTGAGVFVTTLTLMNMAGEACQSKRVMRPRRRHRHTMTT